MNREELIAKTAQDIKDAVLEDEDLIACTSFSQLHDHCDANCLGGCCDDDHPLNDLKWDEMVEVLNEVQSRVDAWLRGD